jgi:hypothetical protein
MAPSAMPIAENFEYAYGSKRIKSLTADVDDSIQKYSEKVQGVMRHVRFWKQKDWQ